jgi:hypothetical protein
MKIESYERRDHMSLLKRRRAAERRFGSYRLNGDVFSSCPLQRLIVLSVWSIEERSSSRFEWRAF